MQLKLFPPRQETTSWAPSQKWKPALLISMWGAGASSTTQTHQGTHKWVCAYAWERWKKHTINSPNGMWRELASSQTFIFSHFKELSSYFWPLILKGVTNGKRGDSAWPAWEAAEWRTWAGGRQGRRGRQRRARKKKYEGAVISFFLPPAPPAVVLPSSRPPLRNHFSLSLIPPITPNHSCCPPLPGCLSPLLVPSLFNPHKWLSETGQVLQNSPRSSTCLIQGLAHCTKTSNTLPTHWEGHSLRLALEHTHTHARLPPTADECKPSIMP